MPVLWQKPFKKVQILDQIVHTLPGIRSLATEVISRSMGGELVLLSRRFQML